MSSPNNYPELDYFWGIVMCILRTILEAIPNRSTGHVIHYLETVNTRKYTPPCLYIK